LNNAQNGFVSFINRKRTERTGDFDGVNVQRDVILERSEKIDELIQITHNNGVSLIRAPPMTGKTSMAQLLTERLRNREHACAFVTGSLGVLFEKQFNDDVEMDFITFMSMANRNYQNTDKCTYLVLDEAQVCFLY
jgi:predicted AAA+ superfamily ATPase